MYLEGMLCPMTNISISCSPNGNEASINIPGTPKAADIKPKTKVDVFFRDTIDGQWYLLFEGQVSKTHIMNSTQGRTFSMTCRDFRMDIRKMPASIVFKPLEDIFEDTRVMGLDNRRVSWDAGHEIENLASILDKFAINATKENGAKGVISAGYKKADNTMVVHKKFFDAVLRGMWEDGTNASDVCGYLNKRLSIANKMYVIPSESGMRFWNENAYSTNLGEALNGSSVFTSYEAFIVRLSGLFQLKMFSCSTPPFIDTEAGFGKEIVSKEKSGIKIAGTTYFLPPMDFTAPPKCNIIFPSMLEQIELSFDLDADFTRGNYDQVHIFDVSDEGAKKALDVAIMIPFPEDKDSQIPLAMSEEERYKGINVHFDSVSHLVAANEIAGAYSSNTQKKLAPDYVNQHASTLKLVKRHAIIKFANARLSGRVGSATLTFNPYLMPGYPMAILSDSYYGMVGKTVVGTIVEVRHNIAISVAGAEMSTTIVFNNARYVDEPTDFTEGGDPIKVEATDKKSASTEAYRKSKTTMVKAGKGKYAKDLTSFFGEGTVSDMYLDREYDPQRVGEMYEQVFRTSSVTDSSFIDGDKEVKFTYNTVHEALEDIDKNLSYEDAMRYAKRSIITLNEYYQHIVGAKRIANELTGSYTRLDKDGKPVEVGPEDQYFGDNIKTKSPTYTSGSTSINELEPRTRGEGKDKYTVTVGVEHIFTTERLVAAKAFIDEVNSVGFMAVKK